MRVLLIHQAFVGYGEPGGTRHLDFAIRLSEQGDHMTVVTGRVNYMTGTSTQWSSPSADKPRDNDAVTVLRAWTPAVHHRSYPLRILAFLAFTVTSIWVGLRSGPVDIVVGTSPPLPQAFSAWLVARVRHKPFLLEIRDLWPEFAIDMGVLRQPVVIAVARWLASFLYQHADHLLVNSPAYQAFLVHKGIPARKISVLPNGVDTTAFDPDSNGADVRDRYNLGDAFVVTYTGAIGQANDIDVILRAAGHLQQLSERSERPDPGIHFLIVGDGKERRIMEARAAERHLRNVTFTGAVPKSEIPGILAASDACVATLMNIPMFATTYPNKVFDYMAAGRPTILAIAGVIRDVVEAADAGIAVPPGDDRAIADAVIRLRDDPAFARILGHNAREHAVANYDRATHADWFRVLLQYLVRGYRGPLASHPLVTTPTNGQEERSAGYPRLKRGIDVVVSLVALVILAPIMLICALAVKATSPGPVVFRQRRLGRGGTTFTIYKFRTMFDVPRDAVEVYEDAPDVTRVGATLRRLKLDELPQVFNVLKGDMSIVGPRPGLPGHLREYTPLAMRRLAVRPGITGLAQVNGSIYISWPERWEYDARYVEEMSLALDLRIILKTIVVIVFGEGHFARDGTGTT